VFLDSARAPQAPRARGDSRRAGLQVALPADADRAHAIEQLDVRIEAGQTLCIVGESGSGKSVLATTVMGLLAKGLSVTRGDIGWPARPDARGPSRPSRACAPGAAPAWAWCSRSP
jgi:peptide/nickel transport system ATP-binding protein